MYQITFSILYKNKNRLSIIAVRWQNKNAWIRLEFRFDLINAYTAGRKRKRERENVCWRNNFHIVLVFAI